MAGETPPFLLSADLRKGYWLRKRGDNVGKWRTITRLVR